ncbi:MAG: diguanylate cyclase (GGDEF)-like protein [Pseudohongiellaceae bacterium]|jgi:diguanylate cyclase (GGDEF)-like protein
MPTAMPQSNTIEFDSAKRLIMSRNLNPEFETENQPLKFRLSSVLQSSLDIEQILKSFFAELRPPTQFSGLLYQHDSRQIEVDLGKKATHSCGYRITTAQDHLGEITFYRGKRFKESELEFLEDILSTLVCPIRNALQYREALIASLTDPLTGSGNRLSLDNTLLREIELAKRHRSPLSLLVIDVDDFKKINDEYGHKTGDMALKGIVQQLTIVNRLTDLSFRYGGEEFVVLLNKTSLSGAKVIGERIRVAIGEIQFKTANKKFKVTVSIGAATLKPNDNKDRLFQRADKALYQAKNSGKNIVIAL